jgi:hypothetical protein
MEAPLCFLKVRYLFRPKVSGKREYEDSSWKAQRQILSTQGKKGKKIGIGKKATSRKKKKPRRPLRKCQGTERT